MFKYDYGINDPSVTFYNDTKQIIEKAYEGTYPGALVAPTNTGMELLQHGPSYLIVDRQHPFIYNIRHVIVALDGTEQYQWEKTLSTQTPLLFVRRVGHEEITELAAENHWGWADPNRRDSFGAEVIFEDKRVCLSFEWYPPSDIKNKMEKPLFWRLV